MVPTNILNRVLHLAFGEITATGTLIHVGEKEYLATSKHFAELLTDKVEVSHGGHWLSSAVRLIGHSPKSDVSVLALPKSLCVTSLEVGLTMAGMIYGEDVYFLGFPFGFDVNGGDFSAGYPIPFVKRACVANFASPELGADFWLDGHNNLGFSGGPVVSVQTSPTLSCTMRGVICSYYSYPEIVEGSNGDTSLTYFANSGLIMAAGINRVLDVISLDPSGPPARTS